jgi:hypothetical protein
MLAICTFLTSLLYGGEVRADLRVGPELALGLPQALQLGVEGYCTQESAICAENLRVYFDIGGLQYPLSSLSQKSLGIFDLETGFRYFFSNGALFTGVALGFRNINLSADLSSFQIDGVVLATNASVSLSTLYVGPLLGVRFLLGNGFAFEADAGLQFAVYATGFMYLKNGSTGANSNNSSNLQVDSGVAISRLASLLLPSLTLVRIVRYF